jgi:hypothetical protein
MRRRGAYEAAALDHARRESPGRLRPAARLLAQRFDPVLTRAPHLAAAARRVWVDDGDDGMADLVLRCAAAVAHGAFDRAARIARAVIDAREKPMPTTPRAPAIAVRLPQAMSARCRRCVPTCWPI